ncbi:MAG: transposase [Myxococcota bacterium]
MYGHFSQIFICSSFPNTNEFKAEAVRLMEECGERTITDIAQSLEVDENLRHRWKQSYAADRNNDRCESPEQELRGLRRGTANVMPWPNRSPSL